MLEIKVYKMNDCDYVASHMNKKETNDWYNKECDFDNELEDVEECDLDNEGVFDEVSKDEAIEKELLPINEARNGTYHCCGIYYFQYLSFREKLKLNGEYKEPYIIASTEY